MLFNLLLFSLVVSWSLMGNLEICYREIWLYGDQSNCSSHFASKTVVVKVTWQRKRSDICMFKPVYFMRSHCSLKNICCSNYSIMPITSFNYRFFFLIWRLDQLLWNWLLIFFPFVYIGNTGAKYVLYYFVSSSGKNFFNLEKPYS